MYSDPKKMQQHILGSLGAHGKRANDLARSLEEQYYGPTRENPKAMTPKQQKKAYEKMVNEYAKFAKDFQTAFNSTPAEIQAAYIDPGAKAHDMDGYRVRRFRAADGGPSAVMEMFPFKPFGG